MLKKMKIFIFVFSGYLFWIQSTLAGPLPSVVSLVSPSGTIATGRPALIWQADANATWYRAYIWDSLRNETFVQWVTSEDACSGSTCALSLSASLINDSYQWFIQSWNNSGAVWSTAKEFTVAADQTPPGRIGLISPGGTINQVNPVFTWQEDTHATWYKLYIWDSGHNQVFSQWYEIQDDSSAYPDVSCSGGICWAGVSSPLPDGSYEWFVKGWNKKGSGQWSNGQTFVVSSAGNAKPVADSFTLAVDSSVPYIEQQLTASDAQGDTLLFELISPASGTGYSSAYINGASGMLYFSLEPVDSDTSFCLKYRVTDGTLYSDDATVNVRVDYLSEEEKDTGREEVDPQDYATFKMSTYNSDLLGSDSDPAQPRSIDLSSNFPTPGDQGQQGSCVGWATAYALKTYQEKVENGWSLNTAAHLFSPAYIYNQIVIGNDKGSYIHEALNLAVNQGVSTLATMKYSDRDYTTQPSAAAVEEASHYKAGNWYRVNDTAQIKAALVNRKPVVTGIKVYESFYNLFGINSVYNTISGQNRGGHAVTIVGYDDDKFGGAFKVINSWSTNWGASGYFWLPYAFAAQGIMSEAYVLEDTENGITPEPQEPTEPEPDYSTLPNLTIASWDAHYDPRPRGAGTLTYTVTNSGSGTASVGADINLMLSKNTDISSSDHYVIYETIPFVLNPGGSVYRDEDNALSFNFPDQIDSGVYYMGLWVDDLDQVCESNEDDNTSVGSRVVRILNSLSDLTVNTWYARWDSWGNGTLTYEIENTGAGVTTTTFWYINLILDRDQVVGNGNEIFLFSEKAEYDLAPGSRLYRDDDSAESFDLYHDSHGAAVQPGVYYMALWVDDMDVEEESNELNNGSYSWGTVSVSGYGNIAGATFENKIEGKAYNGRRLPPPNVLLKKVLITRSVSGDIKMQMLREASDDGIKVSTQRTMTKQNASGTRLIYPCAERIPMPNAGEKANEK